MNNTENLSQYFDGNYNEVLGVYSGSRARNGVNTELLVTAVTATGIQVAINGQEAAVITNKGIKEYLRSASEAVPALASLYIRYSKYIESMDENPEFDEGLILQLKDYLVTISDHRILLGWKWLRYMSFNSVSEEHAKLTAKYLDVNKDNVVLCANAYTEAYAIAESGGQPTLITANEEESIFVRYMNLLSGLTVKPVDNLELIKTNKFPNGIYNMSAQDMTYNKRAINEHTEINNLNTFLNTVTEKAIIEVSNELIEKSSGEAVKLKKSLIMNGYVEIIFQGETNVTTGYIFINKTSTALPLFIKESINKYASRLQNGKINLSKLLSQPIPETSSKASLKELELNSWNLSVKRYVLSATEKRIRQFDTAPLSDLATLIRCQSFSSDGPQEGECFSVITQTDIDVTGIMEIDQKKLVYLRDIDLIKKAEKQSLLLGDIVMVIKSSNDTGQIGLLKKSPETNIIPGQGMLIIRPKENTEKIPVEYLFHYFRSSFFRDLLTGRLRQSFFESTLTKKDIQSLPVVIPKENDIVECKKRFEDLLKLIADRDRIDSEIKSLTTKDLSLFNQAI